MRRPRLRTKLLAAILAPLLFLGVVETALRIAGYRYTPYAAEREADSRRLASEIYLRDPDLLWTLPRSTIVDQPGAGFPDVHTNRLGLRGPEPPGPRRPGEVRILCLGDSVTFGLGLYDRQVWPEQLRRSLSSRDELEGRTVHVLNGGIPGYSCVQGIALLDRLEDYDPDAIVFWFGMNDVQPAWGRPDVRKMGEPGLVTKLASELSGLRTMQLLSRIVDAIRSGEGEATRASVPDFAAAVERLRTLSADGGPQVLFVEYPHRMATTLVQLERVIAMAEEGDAKWVNGHEALLIGIAPMPTDMDLSGEFVDGPEGRELYLPAKGRARSSVAQLHKIAEGLRSYIRGLEERAALLPEGALGRDELLGGIDPAELVYDNCHLTVVGARRVGDVVAERLAADLAR